MEVASLSTKPCLWCKIPTPLECPLWKKAGVQVDKPGGICPACVAKYARAEMEAGCYSECTSCLQLAKCLTIESDVRRYNE